MFQGQGRIFFLAVTHPCYSQAALSGTLNLPMRYDDLAALSPVVRKEVISGELSRRIKSMDTVPLEDLEQIVDNIAALSLSDVLSVIQSHDKLSERVQHATRQLNMPRSSPTKPPSPASQDSRQADALNAPASAPDHPSTPISMQASLSTPPRTESPSGSVPPTSEKDRMAAAVAKLETSHIAELTELLMSLPKRERAMCLFNVEVLRAKIADAKLVLESDDGEEPAKPEPATPATPQAKRITPSAMSPHTPDLSSRGASAAASPAPATPSTASTYSIASLARMSAVEIIRLANASSVDFPLQKPDPLVTKATDEFIDSLRDKPIQMQKQSLGDKL